MVENSGPNVPNAVPLPEDEPVSLRVIRIKLHERTSRPIAFANGDRDQFDSTLLLLNRAEIPTRTSSQDEPVFVGHKLMLDTYPSCGSSVVVIPIQDSAKSHAMRKFFAQSWTTQQIWDDSCEDYTVLRWEEDNDEPTQTWDFVGVFELSHTFPSTSYDYRTGIIWRSKDGTVKYELVTRYSDDNDTWHVNPTHDPRVPLDMLPDEYRNRSLLANLK
jgi:hypothetical protein